LLSRRELIQSGLLIASGCAASRSLLPSAPGVQDQSCAGKLSKTWTIGNSSIRRAIAFRPETGLVTLQLSDLGTQAEFILPVNLHRNFQRNLGQEFSFLCNDQPCAGAGAAFELASAGESVLANGSSLTIRLRHKSLALEASVVYSVYNGHSAMRKHLVLRNTGVAPLHLSHLNIESLGISLGPENETTLLAQYGTIPREIFYTGRSEDACLLLANSRTGTGIAVLSEVPGYMKRTEIAGWEDPHQARIGVMYDTDLMPFERTLKGGEEFITASASLVTFRNGDGFRDPHWQLPSYTAEVLMRRVNAAGPPWIYNTWEPFERGINRDTALALIDAAGDMGFDIFTIDDGWQQQYGENAVNLTAFPGGLQPIQDAVQARGMRLGLWVPVAAIATSTADYRNHPEWAMLDQHGKLKKTSTMGGEMAVMCMASAFHQAAADRIADAIERFRLAYVKLDLTTIFNAYGEAPGCWASGHDHGDWAESLNMIYEGIAAMTASIYRRHPEVLLDLTFELWGQKHVIDAGLLAAGDLDWMSNVDDSQPDSAGPLQARQLLYQRAASIPVEAMLVGNMHADLPSIQVSFATAIGSAPLLLGDLRKLSAADRHWYRDRIAWFKQLRKTTAISQSFFPLGSSLQPNAAAWDGFARLARSGSGVIAVFRNSSPHDSALIQLPLMPSGRFRLRSVINGRELGVFADADWVRGVAVPLPDGVPVEVLEVTSAGG
jgi:alpha-galactosidase